MVDGLGWNWRCVPERFEMDEVARAIAERGIGADVTAFRDDYDNKIRAVLDEAGLDAPKDQRPILGGRDGHHSEHLGHLLAAMQHIPRSYPEATWRSEEHTSELQSLMRISYAVFCLKKKKQKTKTTKSKDTINRQPYKK